MIQPSAGGSALGAAPAAESYRVLRTLALVAVSLGVVILAAAAFVLSYHGIRAVALEAGVSPDLARLYSPMFDVMLVIAGAAVLFLRGAEWIVRTFAWLSLLVLLAAAAGASTLYATNTHLPHRTAATIAAILPWALALLGFFLLLVMLRHARLRRAQSRRATSAAAVAQQADTIPGTVPSDLGAVPVAAAAAGHPSSGADDNWPDGEYPDGAAGSDGQTTELAATGYPGDILVAGRPPADDPGADAAATDEQPAAGEPAAHGTAAGAAVAGASVAGAAVAGAAAGEAAADDPADLRSAPTVPAQALPAQTEPASTEPMSTGPADTGPADTEPAGTSAEAAGTTAGIPLRWPGQSSADQPEADESSLDSEPGQDDPVSDEAHPASRPGVVWVPRAREEPSDEVIKDGPEPSPADPADGTTGSHEASTGAPEAADQGTAPAGPAEGTTGSHEAGTGAPEQGDEPEPSPADPAQGITGSQEAGTGAPEAADASTAPAGPAEGTTSSQEAGPGAPEAADQGTAPAGPAGAATEPGQAEGSWFSAANGSAEPAGAAPEQPGGAPGPAEQPAQPPVTSFWDSVFGPRTPEGTGQSGTSQEQAEGHPATQPSETATADEEPQFDRFRSSPTPPDDE